MTLGIDMKVSRKSRCPYWGSRMVEVFRDRPSSLSHGLGMQLRAVRKAVNATQADLAGELHVSEGLVSRFETGDRVPTDDLFAKWMTKCQVRGQLLSALECMWWMARAKDDPVTARTVPWFETEAQAHTLRHWGLSLIPGRAQTEDYARALFVAWKQPADKIDELVAERTSRKDILEAPDGPDVTIVLWQRILDTAIGSPKVMRDQISRLIELSDNPRIHIHVFPISLGANMGLAGSIDLATTTTTEVLLIDGYPEPVLTSDPARVRAASGTFNSIRSDALNRIDSRNALTEAMGTWS